jgi:hypothetical protein
VVTEGATQKRGLFLIQNVTKWLEELEFEIAIWLSDLFGGTPDLCLASRAGKTPPPPKEIIRREMPPTVSLIDGTGGELPNLKQAISTATDFLCDIANGKVQGFVGETGEKSE